MNLLTKGVFALLSLVLFDAAVYAQKEPSALPIEPSATLDNAVTAAVGKTISKFSGKGVKEANFAATVIDLKNPARPESGSFRGSERIYPASVVKLFYLAAAHDWMERGKLRDTPELRRALRDMIVDSSNDATHQMVDVLTDATGGGELSPEKLRKWIRKRYAVNRYFESIGYRDITVVNKTYCEDLYGRERQMWNGGKVRNMLTTNSTARLMAEIALGRAVTAGRSEQMLELLKRDWESKGVDPEDQAHGFSALALPAGSKVWSKAGWTSSSRHDVAYVELPDGKKFVFCIFTENFATEREILPDIIRNFMAGYGR